MRREMLQLEFSQSSASGLGIGLESQWVLGARIGHLGGLLERLGNLHMGIGFGWESRTIGSRLLTKIH